MFLLEEREDGECDDEEKRRCETQAERDDGDRVSDFLSHGLLAAQPVEERRALVVVGAIRPISVRFAEQKRRA